MLAHARIVVVAPLIVAALAGPLSSAGQADGGCGGAGRPACSILRPAVLEPASRRAVPVDASECIVLVGGLGSEPEETRGFLRPLVASLIGDPRYAIHVFGLDDGRSETVYRYEAYGSIARNALALRGLIRDLSDECVAIDIVAHSMGGAVADRAFSLGATATDGIATYLPLSSPHNGATLAKSVRAGVEADASFATLMRSVVRSVGVHDPTTEAVRDLARISPPRAIRDVTTARLRLVTDAVVLRRDHADRRFEVREYLPRSIAQVEGHGGVVESDEVRKVVQATIERHELPADDRAPEEVHLAARASAHVDEELASVYTLLGAGLVGGAAVTKVAVALATALIEAGSEAGRWVLGALGDLDDAVLLVAPLPLSVIE